MLFRCLSKNEDVVENAGGAVPFYTKQYFVYDGPKGLGSTNIHGALSQAGVTRDAMYKRFSVSLLSI